jgi:hypothetical protein
VTRLDQESLDDIARAHRECIVEKVGISPVCTLVEVAGLAHRDMLSEIETEPGDTFDGLFELFVLL